MSSLSVSKGGFKKKHCNSRKKAIKTSWIQGYCMIIPQFIGFLVFSIYPIIWVFSLSFYEYDGLYKKFVFLQNYAEVLQDVTFWKSVLNTMLIAFGKLPFEMTIALVTAVILSKKIAGVNIFRITYFMPSILSSSVMGLIFYFIFASYGGIVNNILMQFGLEQPINWFGERNQAMFVIITASIWMNFGINMVFFLSGLQSIPQEIYECASLDGASNIMQFYHITLPMLKPITKIILMLSIVGSMQVSDLVLVLTNGGPGGETEVMMTYIFKVFFRWGQNAATPMYGYASALGFVAAVIVAIITVIYLLFTKESDAEQKAGDVA